MPSDLQVSNIKDLTGSNTGLTIASDGQVTIGNLKFSFNTLNPFYDNSQIAFWKFEDNLNDEHGNYNLTGSSMAYRTGYDNKGMDCTGSNYASFPTFGGLTTHSVSFRLYLDASGADRYIFGHQTYGQLLEDSGVLKIYKGAEYTWIGSPSITTGVTYHIVLSVNSGTPTLYLNNIAYTMSSSTLSSVSLTTGYIGTASSATGNSSYAVNGMIDEIRVFNKALTSGEVSTLYNKDL